MKVSERKVQKENKLTVLVLFVIPLCEVRGYSILVLTIVPTQIA